MEIDDTDDSINSQIENTFSNNKSIDITFNSTEVSFDKSFNQLQNELSLLDDKEEDTENELSLDDKEEDTENELSLDDKEEDTENELSYEAINTSQILIDEFKENNEINLLKKILKEDKCPIIMIEEPQNQSKVEIILNQLEQEFKYRLCFIDCLDVSNFNILFGTIFRKLLKPDLDLNNSIDWELELNVNADIINYQNFIDKINKIKPKQIKLRNPIITLNNADYLAKKYKDYLKFLIEINDLIPEFQFTIILISSLKINYFHSLGFEFNHIQRIEFKPFKINEIKVSILQCMPSIFTLTSYKSFVNQIVDILSGSCLEFNKLRSICEKLYLKFMNQSKNKKELNSISNQIKFISDHNSEIVSNLIFQTENKLEPITELTICGIYVLIAAYLASYNSSKTDLRFFSKQGENKTRKKSKKAFANEKQFGPKNFVFERFYQIYYQIQALSQGRDDIHEMKISAPTHNLFHQFQSFVSLKLIVNCNSTSKNYSPYSSSSKYCIAEFIKSDFIKDLAKGVDVDLDRFLESNLIK